MFFDVILKPQTWRNAGYLVLAFPLGIFYFVFLVTGFSLGFGLFITLFGIPILLGVLLAAHWMGEFERVTTNLLLELDTPASPPRVAASGIWEKVKHLVSRRETWNRVFYLFLVFPLGIAGFTLVITTVALFTQVATPFFYQQSWWPTAFEWPRDAWAVDSLGRAILVAVAALIGGFVLLHITNGLARVWGEFARLMLAPAPQADQPATPPPAKAAKKRKLHETSL